MMNKPDINKGIRTAETWLLSLLVVMCVVTPPFAWIGNVMGYPVRNLFSEEGIRWVYAHMQDSFTTSLLALVFPVVLLCGAVSRSGLGTLLTGLYRRGGRRYRITYRQKTALLTAGIFLAVCGAASLLLILSPQAILLGVTGEIFPSPFIYGILPVTTLCVQGASMIYAHLSNHLHGTAEMLSVMYWGIRQYAAWIFIAILAAQFFHSVVYIFDLSA